MPYYVLSVLSYPYVNFTKNETEFYYRSYTYVTWEVNELNVRWRVNNNILPALSKEVFIIPRRWTVGSFSNMSTLSKFQAIKEILVAEMGMVLACYFRLIRLV